MGYDSRLYVGRPAFAADRAPRMVLVEATLELGRMGYSQVWWDFLDRHPCPPEPQWYVWADDGETKITLDKYDDRLQPLPYDEVVSVLESLGQGDLPRLRARAAAAWLKEFTWSLLDERLVLHYGH